MIELFLLFIAGLSGDVGCSGDPNPPTDIDIWNYEHGQFTSRQGDIMIGDCYNKNNLSDNTTITVTLQNGTMIDLLVFKNGTIIEKD